MAEEIWIGTEDIVVGRTAHLVREGVRVLCVICIRRDQGQDQDRVQEEDDTDMAAAVDIPIPSQMVPR